MSNVYNTASDELVCALGLTLPRAEVELAVRDRYVDRGADQRRLDVRWHVVWQCGDIHDPCIRTLTETKTLASDAPSPSIVWRKNSLRRTSAAATIC